MTVGTPIGPATRQAFHFLRGIHKDTAAVMETLDIVMAAEKWYPTQKNRISSELSNGMSGDHWLIQSIYRVYVNSPKTADADRIVAVHIDFDPPNAYEQPICLCIAARFPTTTSTQQIWDRWSYAGSERVLQYLAQGPETPAIPQELLHGKFLPEAQAGSAFVVNLCDLVDQAAVSQRVVKPLLEAVAKL